jgi:UDP-glucuronate decarboxylase
METPDEITGPINLGNPNEFTMLELAERIISAAASESKIEHFELPSDDPKQRKPDITKARSMLNWEPRVQLSEGLEKTIQYFASQIQKS